VEKRDIDELAVDLQSKCRFRVDEDPLLVLWEQSRVAPAGAVASEPYIGLCTGAWTRAQHAERRHKHQEAAACAGNGPVGRRTRNPVGDEPVWLATGPADRDFGRRHRWHTYLTGFS
jgi:hypothetical protein